jgi:hypothetical protein
MQFMYDTVKTTHCKNLTSLQLTDVRRLIKAYKSSIKKKLWHKFRNNNIPVEAAGKAWCVGGGGCGSGGSFHSESRR